MSLLIDTSAYAALDANNLEIKRLFRQTDNIFMPVIVYGELVSGFKKGNRIEQNLDRLERFLHERRVQLVPIDKKVANQYARLRCDQEAIGKSVAPNDLWIAAICRQLQLPLLTLDSDFARIADLELVALGE